MATKKQQEKTIILDMPKIHTAEITIVGDSDLCLNKMSIGNIRDLPQFSSGKTKKPHNFYGDLITAIHWEKKIDEEAIYDNATEDMLHELLENNRPCISGFGMKKAFAVTITRNNIDSKTTKFMETVNVVEDLIPVTFTEHKIRDFLVKVGRNNAAMIAYINQFSGWNATFTIRYSENAYTFDSIINIINLAGFGGGICSGRRSGFGRFHVSEIKQIS